MLSSCNFWAFGPCSAGYVRRERPPANQAGLRFSANWHAGFAKLCLWWALWPFDPKRHSIHFSILEGVLQRRNIFNLIYIYICTSIYSYIHIWQPRRFLILFVFLVFLFFFFPRLFASLVCWKDVVLKSALCKPCWRQKVKSFLRHPLAKRTTAPGMHKCYNSCLFTVLALSESCSISS